ncbi:hypothetical protein SARC_05701 [Sphaeroforma arctica JP610]|uniref:Uncharacterized protein n=1 Tax=Sphaeroforma arctica JP610 TaxID=667725 RepID=A0A0L0G1C2_9EUKA|nr:hypothetical protein SARC_05701 [Sphaeroforma arctica JP610]KNC82003.1 hypothetical protein SARC_05701 [Sphaeroforma arctica JP610]|eukprot:XP_014155905.1 hypothetical protein SARC_05701 [Sphaeroforma arctica JP610]
MIESHSNPSEITTHPSTKAALSPSTCISGFIDDKETQASRQKLIRESWKRVTQMSVLDGEYPVMRFTVVYFDLLFNHLPNLKADFDSPDTQSRFLGKLLSLLVNMKDAPQESIDADIESLREIYIKLGVKVETQVVFGRVLILTLHTTLTPFFLQSSFSTLDRKAWVTMYVDYLIQKLANKSEMKGLDLEILKDLIYQIDVYDKDFYSELKSVFSDCKKTMSRTRSTKSSRPNAWRKSFYISDSSSTNTPEKSPVTKVGNRKRADTTQVMGSKSTQLPQTLKLVHSLPDLNCKSEGSILPQTKEPAAKKKSLTDRFKKIFK